MVKSKSLKKGGLDRFVVKKIKTHEIRVNDDESNKKV